MLVKLRVQIGFKDNPCKAPRQLKLQLLRAAQTLDKFVISLREPTCPYTSE